MTGVLTKLANIVSNGQCDIHTMPWWLLRAPHVKVIKNWLQEQYSPPTANKYLAALRQTLQNCWELDLMNTDDYMRATAVKNVKHRRLESAEGRHISYTELSTILITCFQKNTVANIRDATIISLAYAAGLRRSEIANLKAENYDAGKASLAIIDTKHNSTRNVPTEASGLQEMMELWLNRREPIPTDTEVAPPLFYRIYKSGKSEPMTPLGPQAVSDVITKRAKDAGIENITAHDFRRTFAGDLLDAGADISTVQKLMGHANSNTTANYDRRGERARRTAISKLKLPMPKLA